MNPGEALLPALRSPAARPSGVRSGLIAALAAAAVQLAGCATQAAAGPPTPQVAALAALGPLVTVTVEVAGAPRRFLLDTGGGMTVFSPDLAARSGCVMGASLRGYRMSGERIEAPRCEAATLRVAGWASRPHTVLVLDLNTLLPPDWPRLDGLLSLSSFEREIVTIDLPGRRLVVNDAPPHNARSPRVRIERAIMGLSRVAFVASRHGDTDIWLEVDTGSTSALILDESLAARLGLKTPLANQDAGFDLRFDDGPPVRTSFETSRLIFDGNLGQGTMRSWVLTFDLANERVWFRLPAIAAAAAP